MLAARADLDALDDLAPLQRARAVEAVHVDSLDRDAAVSALGSVGLAGDAQRVHEHLAVDSPRVIPERLQLPEGLLAGGVGLVVGPGVEHVAARAVPGRALLRGQPGRLGRGGRLRADASADDAGLALVDDRLGVPVELVERARAPAQFGQVEHILVAATAGGDPALGQPVALGVLVPAATAKSGQGARRHRRALAGAAACPGRRHSLDRGVHRACEEAGLALRGDRRHHLALREGPRHSEALVRRPPTARLASRFA